MQLYCVYFTIYLGKRLPPFYIGSTKIENINKGYHGSVSSAEWGDIWRAETKNHSELFKTFIIPGQYRSSIAEIIKLEQRWQIEFDVVKDPYFANKCYAQRGFFGSSASAKKGALSRIKNGNSKRTPDSVARAIATKRDTGVLQLLIAKAVATKKSKNGFVLAAAKALATKRRRGTDKHQQVAIDKLKANKTGLRAWNNGEITKMSRESLGEEWMLGSTQCNSDEQRSKSSQIHRGASWWTNGIIDKHSKDCPGPEWRKGRNNFIPSKTIGDRSKGKFWWTDGQSNVMSVSSPGDGWIRGMTKASRSSKSNLHN